MLLYTSMIIACLFIYTCIYGYLTKIGYVIKYDETDEVDRFLVYLFIILGAFMWPLSIPVYSSILLVKFLIEKIS